MDIKAFHDPFDTRYRLPFGALPCGEEISLRLFVEGGEPESVTLRVWHGSERLITPAGAEHADGGTVYRFSLTAPNEPGLLWYSFRVEAAGERLYVGAADGELRCGCVCGHELPKDFRVTVYDGAFDTPDWFKGCITYQIFPDRFRRGEYPGLAGAVAYHRAMGRTVNEKNWGEQVDYLPRPGRKYYEPNDYYFGNFQGIIDSIPYILSLNVGAVYLNPVFESPFNHRYSISDYMKIDPLIGTEEDFSRMCAELKARGVRVILDGVFSHTGDDSVYFDRHGNYGGGAWGNENSPYREWYDFSDKYKCGFRSWWGFETLPEVNELTPSYMAFIARVLEKWMRLGASGWRLDVADELPNDFIRFLRRTVKNIDPEALLIGEVWENAAVKEGDIDGRGTIARRGYTDGDMLDGVMDYPFADAVCAFLNGEADAFALRGALCSLLSDYPAPFMRAGLGLLGSHDAYRVLSRLSGAPEKDTLSRPEQAVWLPEKAAHERGKKRLMQAAALQFSMPFAPCIFYGDEVGTEGLTDPFCRKPFPWDDMDEELLNFYKELTSERKASPALMSGSTAFAAPDRDVFVIIRSKGSETRVTAVSRAEKRVTIRARELVGEAAAAIPYDLSFDIAENGIKRLVFAGDKAVC